MAGRQANDIREISSTSSDEVLLDMEDDGVAAALAANSDEVLVKDEPLLAT